MNKKWQIYETDTEETKRIAEKYKINELLASIIVNRKIKDEEADKVAPLCLRQKCERPCA